MAGLASPGGVDPAGAGPCAAPCGPPSLSWGDLELGGLPSDLGPCREHGPWPPPWVEGDRGLPPRPWVLCPARPPVSGARGAGCRPHSCWHLWAQLVTCWVLVGDPVLHHRSPRDQATQRGAPGLEGSIPLVPHPHPLTPQYPPSITTLVPPPRHPGLWPGPPGTLGFILQALWAPPSSPVPPGACARGLCQGVATPGPCTQLGSPSSHSMFLQLDPVPPPAQTPSI